MVRRSGSAKTAVNATMQHSRQLNKRFQIVRFFIRIRVVYRYFWRSEQ